MKFLLSTIFFVLLNTWCFSQESIDVKDGVSILEEVTKKRTFLYAENTNETAKQVFLKVDATGYRRRADRPLIETIPPKTKKLLITLIPLTDIESTYTYTFIVNDETENIHAVNVSLKERKE